MIVHLVLDVKPFLRDTLIKLLFYILSPHTINEETEQIFHLLTITQIHLYMSVIYSY